MNQFSPAFSLEESEKYDFLTNENSKYLLYKLKLGICQNVKDVIGLNKIKEKNNQLVIERTIGAVENKQPIRNQYGKNP